MIAKLRRPECALVKTIICFAAIAGQQCSTRNITDAANVGRPCRKPCQPGDGRCKSDKLCLCDHECGYSCINLGKLFLAMCSKIKSVILFVFVSEYFESFSFPLMQSFISATFSSAFQLLMILNMCNSFELC